MSQLTSFNFRVGNGCMENCGYSFHVSEAEGYEVNLPSLFIHRFLALVCILREDNFEKKGMCI